MTDTRGITGSDKLLPVLLKRTQSVLVKDSSFSVPSIEVVEPTEEGGN